MFRFSFLVLFIHVGFLNLSHAYGAFCWVAEVSVV